VVHKKPAKFSWSFS